MKYDYKKEYATHGALPSQKKRRASRNAVRNKLARAGALSSLGARLEIASPIDRKRVPPKKEKRKIFNHANKLPCPIDTPRINMPIVNRIIV